MMKELLFVHQSEFMHHIWDFDNNQFFLWFIKVYMPFKYLKLLIIVFIVHFT